MQSLYEENISSMKISYEKIRKGEDMITSLNNAYLRNVGNLVS
jgi:hypothetical protein